MNRHLAHWKPLAALLVAAMFLPGCILELLTATAIQGELQAQNAASSMKQLEQTRRMADEMKISNAIDIYRAENGSNPPSLQALVPEYLDAVPVDPAGRPLYVYDPNTGRFADAAKARSDGSAMPSGRSSAPISGGSPAAEQMQAIGIMNELNSQPAPSGARARDQVVDITQQQNEQYDKLLNDLDL